MESLGYKRSFKSENVSHYIIIEANHPLTRIDFLHAFRPASLGMLKRAERIPYLPDCHIPVAKTEDIIGLKIQAAVNDPEREENDWNDIHLLVDHSAKKISISTGN